MMQRARFCVGGHGEFAGEILRLGLDRLGSSPVSGERDGTVVAVPFDLQRQIHLLTGDDPETVGLVFVGLKIELERAAPSVRGEAIGMARTAGADEFLHAQGVRAVGRQTMAQDCLARVLRASGGDGTTVLVKQLEVNICGRADTAAEGANGDPIILLAGERKMVARTGFLNTAKGGFAKRKRCSLCGIVIGLLLNHLSCRWFQFRPNVEATNTEPISLPAAILHIAQFKPVLAGNLGGVHKPCIASEYFIIIGIVYFAAHGIEQTNHRVGAGADALGVNFDGEALACFGVEGEPVRMHAAGFAVDCGGELEKGGLGFVGAYVCCGGRGVECDEARVAQPGTVMQPQHADAAGIRGRGNGEDGLLGVDAFDELGSAEAGPEA